MRIFFAAILCLLLNFGISHSQNISPRLQSAMAAAAPAEKIAVIIEMSGKASPRQFLAPGKSVRQMSKVERGNHRSNLVRTLKERADLSQASVRGLLRRNGVDQQKALWINNSIAAKVSPEVLQLLSEMLEVARIRVDAVVTMPVVVPAATNGIEDNLHLINAPALWALGFEGQGTVVAIVDSGVDHLHPELGTAWRGGNNSWFNPVAADCLLSPGFCTTCDESEFVPCDSPTTTPGQTIYHGTGVAGIMVGGNLGGTSIGVAPQAQWIAAKIFDSNDTATTSNIHLAFQWLLDPDGNPATDDAPDVVNSSWGLDPYGNCFEEFRPDVQALKAAGIAAVFSAGNDGTNGSFTDNSPANYSESIAVGSVGTPFSLSELSDFSSRGPSSCDGGTYPELVAPGYFIKSTDYSFGGVVPNSYLFLTGTSFAAPHVAGAMALLAQAFPFAPLTDIEAALNASAQDLGSHESDNDYGNGLIDVLGAYDWLSQAPSIDVYDPVPPENDRILDFGTIAAATPGQKTFYIRNRGSVDLSIGTLSLSGLEFSISVDNCSNQILTAGQNCGVTVRFISAVDGVYSGNINLPSEDIDEPSITVSLSGVVSGVATQFPSLSVSDSVPPIADQSLPFGALVVGNSRSESFQIANDDLGDLVLGPLDSSTLNSEFTVVSDGCSNQTLVFGASCDVVIDFAPVAVGTFNSVLSLPSNDSASPHQLTLSGTSIAPNVLPPVPSLVAPEQGALTSSTVTFTWRQLPDPDGNPVTNNLYVSEDPNFSGATPIQVTLFSGGQQVGFAQFGGALLLAGLLVRCRRGGPLLRVMLIAMVLSALVSCGRSDSTPSDLYLRSYTVSLSSQTTYFWKVAADDGNGGLVESSVSSFSTE